MKNQQEDNEITETSNIQEASPEEVQNMILNGEIKSFSSVAEVASKEKVSKKNDVSIKFSKDELSKVGLSIKDMSSLQQDSSEVKSMKADKEIEEINKENDQRVTINPDQRILQSFLQSNEPINAGYDVSKIKISEEEKEKYLRCLLENNLYSEDIKMLKGKLTFSFISKTLEQQNLINEIVKSLSLEMDDERKMAKYSASEVLIIYLQLHILISVIMVNGKDVYDYAGTKAMIDSEASFEEKKLYLINKIKNKIEVLPKQTWFILWNAAKIFEAKESKLNEFMINEDF